MAERDKIISAIRKVFDPEIPVNIYDLGLVYDISMEEGNVKVKMTLTSPGCPLSVYLPALVEDAIRAEVPEVKNVEVELVWDPPWTPLRVTEEGRKRLKELYGVDIVEEWMKRTEQAFRGSENTA